MNAALGLWNPCGASWAAVAQSQCWGSPRPTRFRQVFGDREPPTSRRFKGPRTTWTKFLTELAAAKAETWALVWVVAVWVFNSKKRCRADALAQRPDRRQQGPHHMGHERASPDANHWAVALLGQQDRQPSPISKNLAASPIIPPELRLARHSPPDDNSKPGGKAKAPRSFLGSSWPSFSKTGLKCSLSSVATTQNRQGQTVHGAVARYRTMTKANPLVLSGQNLMNPAQSSVGPNSDASPARVL